MSKLTHNTPALEGKDAKKFIKQLIRIEAEKETAKRMVEMQHFSKSKIPRCLDCKVDFLRLDEHTWKPNCKCIKEDVRLSVG